MKSRRGQAHVRISRPCRSAEQSRLKPKRKWSSRRCERRRTAGSARVSRRFNRTGGGMLITAYGPAGRPASQPHSFFFPIEKRCRFASYQRADLSFSSFIYSCTGIRFVSPLLLGLLGLLGSVGSLGPRQPGITNTKTRKPSRCLTSPNRERENGTRLSSPPAKFDFILQPFSFFLFIFGNPPFCSTKWKQIPR